MPSSWMQRLWLTRRVAATFVLLGSASEHRRAEATRHVGREARQAGRLRRFCSDAETAATPLRLVVQLCIEMVFVTNARPRIGAPKYEALK